MRIRAAVPAAALLLIGTLAWPSPSEAGQRDRRHRGHRSVYDSYRAPHFRSYHAPRYRFDQRRSSRFAFRPRPRNFYYAPPPVYVVPPPVFAPHGYGYGYGYGHRYAPPLVSFHSHGRLRCNRPHFSLHLGF